MQTDTTPDPLRDRTAKRLGYGSLIAAAVIALLAWLDGSAGWDGRLLVPLFLVASGLFVLAVRADESGASGALDRWASRLTLVALVGVAVATALTVLDPLSMGLLKVVAVPAAILLLVAARRALPGFPGGRASTAG